MNFKNQICPVCKKVFSEDDDIVVCPVCGTPHHRDCYKENGECANELLHKTGFVYTSVNEEVGEIKDKSNKEVPKANTFDTDFENNGEADTTDTAGNEEEVIRQIVSDINENNGRNLFIDSKPVSHFEAAIGKNQRYFIPRFLILERTNKKSVYNFLAFLFPLAWTLYRKMYKFSAAILAFYIIVTAASVFPILTNKEYMSASLKLYTEEGAEGISNVLAYENGQDVLLTDTETEFLNIAENLSVPGVLTASVKIACFAIRILIAVFGTKLYRDTLIKKINTSYALYGDENSIINYLKKKGGTLPFIVAVIAGIFDLINFY